MMLRSLFVVFWGLLGFTGEEEAKWDVNEAHGPNREVKFTTTEGTWTNLDVSPDGREIVFDLLGDIYILPITGGKAKRLLGDPAMDLQPRFSPDGKKISFTSDRGGGDNIWIMNRDGSDPRAVTDEDFRLLNNAVWTTDSQYIIARKHFTSRRSLGAGEMWMYHVTGGKGIGLTVRKNDQQDAGEPAFSPDGRYLYFSEDMSPGPRFQYNKDPHGQIYVVRELDMETGELRNLITGNGGSARPQPSPDGKTIAFVRRVRSRTVLFLYDRASGAQRPLFDGLNHDQQEAWAVFGIYPNFAWTPDSRHIVIWAGGGIKKIEVAGGAVSQIPFEAVVDKTIAEPVRFKRKITEDRFEPKMIRDARTSPDGKHLVFHAVGHLWKKRLPDGKPERLTKDAHYEYEPAFSPDGKNIVYTTWSDANLGAVYLTPLNGKKPRKLTTRPGYYREPRFSPGGNKIVFRRTRGNRLLGFVHGVDTGLYWLDIQAGEPHFIREDGYQPRFGPKSARVYFMTGGGMSKQYQSTRLDGGDLRTHFKLKYANQVVPSPDWKWLAFNELFQAYVAPFPPMANALDLNKDTKAVPVHKITRDVGTDLHWSGDGQNLHWMEGPEYFTRSLQESFTWLEGAAEEPTPLPERGVSVGLRVPVDVPSGKLALVGARVITMAGDRVLEKGTVVIERNRIVAVGEADAVNVPEDAKVMELEGATIIPGLIDVHAHNNHFYDGPSPQENWSYLANLAYGVTTGHDPSARTTQVFSQAELVRAGLMRGPRIYSTGSILYGADGDFRVIINKLDDAASHLRRLKAVGAFSVKSYNQPRRNQRQQILKAARDEEMLVVLEGGSTFFHNLSMIIDGSTGIEHNLPIAPLYRDVIGLWGPTAVGYTPTLVVNFGGVSGEYYWYQHTNVWEQERLLNFHPRAELEARSRRRQMLHEDDFYYMEVARAAKALTDAGGRVNMGAHGQLQGLAAHWELWMFAQGGMTPMEVLRAGTLNGAFYLGLDDELGSLEPGKHADLLVLNKNPLENIRHTEAIRYVVVNGRIYDAETMNEIGNHPRERGQLYWERHGVGQVDPSLGNASPSGHSCGCRPGR